MASKKFLDLEQFKRLPVEKTKIKPRVITSIRKEINKKTKITSETGSNNTVEKWFTLLNDGYSEMVHCPLAPEKHNNNDASASCSMKKNGDYLNLNCFGCDSKASISFGKTKNSSQGEFVYIVSSFNKEDVLGEVVPGLNDMTSIVSEFVRLLPPLRKEKKDD